LARQHGGGQVTASEFGLFLNAAMLICAAMAVASLFRARSRGVAAYLMAAAFLGLGGVLYLVRIEAPPVFVLLGCGAVASLLFAEFGLRAAKQAERGGE
jgi:hypothetical protein